MVLRWGRFHLVPLTGRRHSSYLGSILLWRQNLGLGNDLLSGGFYCGVLDQFVSLYGGSSLLGNCYRCPEYAEIAQGVFDSCSVYQVVH